MSKAGDDLEIIVSMIEKSISPDSTVGQNIFLPVLNSRSNRMRQCDVVITSGSNARKTVTLVEVQDRTSKVSIGTFCDWLEKLKEVGANHLICISRLEFPESIKEKAMLEGNRVLLIHLKELLPEKLPLGLLSFHMSYENVSITNVRNIKCQIEPGSFKDKSLAPDFSYLGDKVWSKNKKDIISLIEVIEPILKEKHKDGVDTITDSINLTFKDDKRLMLYFSADNDFVKVGVSIELDYIYDVHYCPLSVSSYKQMDSGVLAWVFEVNKETSQGKIKLKIPVVQHACGGYQMLGFVNSTEFNSKFELVKLERPNQCV